MKPEQPMKCYHRDAFNENLFVESYFYPTSDQTLVEELVGFPMRMLSKLCTKENISGRVLMDASVGSLLFQVIPMCESFSEVTILEFSESSFRGIEAWRNKEEGAFDWYFASQFTVEPQISRDQWREKEDVLRNKINQVLKVDFGCNNPTDLTNLPKADCLVSMYVLMNISEDYQSFCHNIRKLASLLNPGGVLLLAGAYNATFYHVGEEKFFLFSLTEEMLMKAMKEAGLTVQLHETLKSKVRCDTVQYEQLFVVKAIRE